MTADDPEVLEVTNCGTTGVRMSQNESDLPDAFRSLDVPKSRRFVLGTSDFGGGTVRGVN